MAEQTREIGLYGLGRMGGNMVIRILRGGHRVVASNRSPGPIQEAASQGAVPAANLREMVSKLEQRPRVVWMMVPSGDVTEEVFQEAMDLLSPGDIIVDGSNSRWTDTMRRAKLAEQRGLHMQDCGTSGGVWGLKVGYSLMVGGEKPIYDFLEPVYKTLAPEDGYGYMGTNGAGHFVKMVHNGIEYGMLQAYGEGFEILKRSAFDPDLLKVTRVWLHGSVVRSWLLELAELAFQKNPTLADIRGYVDDTGEGRWTVQAAIDESVPAYVIAASLLARFNSRDPDAFQYKVIAALRNEFGGHAIQTESGTTIPASGAPGGPGQGTPGQGASGPGAAGGTSG